MTLLTQFINHLCALCQLTISQLKALLALVLLLGLQACASPTTDSAVSADNLNDMGKDIVDMVDVGSATAPNSNTNTNLATDSTNQPISTKQQASRENQYLSQSKQRLANVPKEVIEQYQQAIDLIKQQQWQAANKLLDKVILAQPQLSGPYVNKAIIALDLITEESHEGSKETSPESSDIAARHTLINQADLLLDKALLANTNNPYAYQMKGLIARMNGQFELSESYYKKALAIWPDYPQAQLNIAILLELYRGRLLDARPYYLAYMATNPNDKQVQRSLAGLDLKITRAGLTIPNVEVKNTTSEEG